ncbi:MAG: hypothetical protein ACLSUM_12575 [Dysosmobacter welbionis]
MTPCRWTRQDGCWYSCSGARSTERWRKERLAASESVERNVKARMRQMVRTTRTCWSGCSNW